MTQHPRFSGPIIAATLVVPGLALALAMTAPLRPLRAADAEAGVQPGNCSYDFARRRLVCDPENEPGLPSGAQGGQLRPTAPRQPDTTPPPTGYDGRDLTFYPSYRPDAAPRLEDPADAGLLELRVRGVTPDDTLNLRYGPSTDEPILDALPHNASGLRLIACRPDNWCKVRYRGLTGYVSRSYVTPVGGQQKPPQSQRGPRLRVVKVAWGDTLNVRAGPSSAHAVVGRLPADARGIELRGRCQPEWCPVAFGRIRGWAGRYYLARDY